MSAKNLLYAPIMSTLTNGLSELCKKETLWQYAWYDLHYLCCVIFAVLYNSQNAYLYSAQCT